MNIIEQIKAEIERRIKELSEAESDYREEGCDSISALLISGISELQKILSFLSTLEPEKPMNQEGLEEEINLAWEKLEKDYSPSALDKTIIIVSGLVGEKQFSNIARHFAQWGAEHLKK